MKKKNEPLRTLKNPSQKFEYIFTIGCFDKFHKGHIKLLERNINFNNYGLTRTRTFNFFPKKPDSNMISVKTNYHDIYCDIYAQPAFPLLTTKILNGIEYTIPINPELFLEVLFDKSWRIPSNKHSNQKNHRGNGLVKSKYSKYWDTKYKIFKFNF